MTPAHFEEDSGTMLLWGAALLLALFAAVGFLSKTVKNRAAATPSARTAPSTADTISGFSSSAAFDATPAAPRMAGREGADPPFYRPAGVETAAAPSIPPDIFLSPFSSGTSTNIDPEFVAPLL